MSEAPKNRPDESVEVDEATAQPVAGGCPLSLIDQTRAHSPTRSTSRVYRAVRYAPLFALTAGAGLILLWGATHMSQSTLRSGTAEVGQVTTLSSQQLLSQLRVKDGSLRSSAVGAPLPASLTLVATPMSPHR
jgi:hypothetical protein